MEGQPGTNRCGDCRFSRALTGLDKPTLICYNAPDADGVCCVVDPAGTCDRFDNQGHSPAQIAAALAPAIPVPLQKNID